MRMRETQKKARTISDTRDISMSPYMAIGIGGENENMRLKKVDGMNVKEVI